MRSIRVAASVVLFLSLLCQNGLNFVGPLDLDEIRWNVGEKVKKAEKADEAKAMLLYGEVLSTLKAMKLAGGQAYILVAQRLVEIENGQKSNPGLLGDGIAMLATRDLSNINACIHGFCFWLALAAAVTLVVCYLDDKIRPWVTKRKLRVAPAAPAV